MCDTLNHIIEGNHAEFHDDMVMKQDLIIKEKFRIENDLNNVKKEVRLTRASEEYELLGNYQLAEEVLLLLVLTQSDPRGLNQPRAVVSLYSILAQTSKSGACWIGSKQGLGIVSQSQWIPEATGLAPPHSWPVIFLNSNQEALKIIYNLYLQKKKDLLLLNLLHIIYKLFLKDEKKANIYKEKLRL